MIGYRIAPTAPRTPPPSQLQPMMAGSFNQNQLLLGHHNAVMAYGGAAFPQQAYGLLPVASAGGYPVIGRATTPPPAPKPKGMGQEIAPLASFSKKSFMIF